MTEKRETAYERFMRSRAAAVIAYTAMLVLAAMALFPDAIQ